MLHPLVGSPCHIEHSPLKLIPHLTQALLNRATQLLAADPGVRGRGVAVNAVDPGWCRCVYVVVGGRRGSLFFGFVCVGRGGGWLPQ